METAIEEWDIIPGSPWYEASTLGRIRSWRKVPSGTRKVPLIRKPNPVACGYFQVHLGQGGGKKRPYLVHKAIASTFLGEPKEGMQVNHINGNKADNRICNLEYVTRSENAKHAYRLGLQSKKGERHHLAKLNEEKVQDIRRRLLRGEACAKIAEDYPVTRRAINSIKNGTGWPHLPWPALE